MGFPKSYAPLEIILSDDCSSDRTFQIMQKIAETLEGSHKVMARRNSFNLGTALHVQSAFDESSGQLFAVVAGDDIRPWGSCLYVCRALCVVRSGYAVG